MNSKDLQKKKDADLQKMLTEKKEELREFKFGMSGAAKSGVSANSLRKDIARIMTEANARRAAATEAK